MGRKKRATLSSTITVVFLGHCLLQFLPLNTKMITLQLLLLKTYLLNYLMTSLVITATRQTLRMFNL